MVSLKQPDHNVHLPDYPELLSTFLFGVVIYWMDGSSVYLGLGAFFVIATLGLGVFSVRQPKNDFTSFAVVWLLAIATGILQFNYLPSLMLWLLIFTRLILLKKSHTLPVTLITLCVAIISLLTAKYLLPSLHFTVSQQLTMNLLMVGCAIIIIAVHLWRLVNIIEHYRQLSSHTQQRLESLVTMTNRLTRYLPSRVWQPILKNQNSTEIISQRRKLTILFSDIVGFTDLSDTICPDHLANILNTYFDRMTQITMNYGATLDKFIGDGMLCYFGDEPNSNEHDNALRCVRMAIDMRREMAVLRRQWQNEGFVGLHIRMGINTGYCYVGNFGSRNRMTYTVIGKEANFAARLESATQKDQILISESTFNLVHSKYPCEAVGERQLKGLNQSVKVWQVLEPKTTANSPTDWVDYNLPGFNLHLLALSRYSQLRPPSHYQTTQCGFNHG